MAQHIKIKDIAEAMGKTPQAIKKTLDKLSVPYVWERGIGGRQRCYVSNDLPYDMRMAMTGQGQVTALSYDGFKDSVGALAARSLIENSARVAEADAIAKETGLLSFESLSDSQKEQALARREFISYADDFVKAAGYVIRSWAKRSKLGDMAFIKAYNEGLVQASSTVQEIVGNTVSYSSLKRFADRFAEEGLVGLVDQYHNPKKGRSTLSTSQQDFVLAVMCKNPKTSNHNIRRALIGKFGFEIPSESVIARFRTAWIKANSDLWLYYTNPDAWKNKSMFAFGTSAGHVVRLNQMWEADSTPTDVMLTDGRHAIVGMIDIYSRRIKYIVSPTSSAQAVCALIRSCIEEWGVPEVIKTDNGKDYKSTRVVTAIADLGIEQFFCTPFHSWEKPYIERSFRSFSHDIVELLPGYIGHNVPERKAIEARRSFSERIMGQNKEAVELNMSSSELQSFINRWINFEYHNRPHRGLSDRSPLEMVRKWKEPIRRISSMRALDMLLAEAPDNRGRKITKKGVKVNNKFYYNPAFAGYEGEKVHVLLDATNLGQVFIYLINDDDSKEFLCPAIDPVFYGIDPIEFASRAKKRQERIKKEEVAKLKKQAKEQGVQEALESYMDMAEVKAGKIIAMPQKSVAYSTDSLDQAGIAGEAGDALALSHRRSKASKALLSGTEIDLEKVVAEVSAPRQKSSKVTLFRTDMDQYSYIRDRIKAGGSMTVNEKNWLESFYKETETGRSCMALEGDLREQYVAKVAEA